MDTLENQTSWTETERRMLSDLLGAPLTGIVVDEALIRENAWQHVTLPAQAPHAGSQSAAARFGHVYGQSSLLPAIQPEVADMTADRIDHTPARIEIPPTPETVVAPAEAQPRAYRRAVRLPRQAAPVPAKPMQVARTEADYKRSPLVRQFREGVGARMYDLPVTPTRGSNAYSGIVLNPPRTARSSMGSMVVVALLLGIGIFAVGLSMGIVPSDPLRAVLVR